MTTPDTIVATATTIQFNSRRDLGVLHSWIVDAQIAVPRHLQEHRILDSERREFVDASESRIMGRVLTHAEVLAWAEDFDPWNVGANLANDDTGRCFFAGRVATYHLRK